MNTKPNIVYVLTDDQGYGDLGCTGNPIINTPNIDMFYNESLRLTDFHVGPTCAPTRSGLMTGHYANSTGVWHTVGGRSLLRRDEVTLPAVLKEAGYRTGIFGKWHLGDAYPYRPMDRGFEETVVHGGGGISQTPDYWGNDYFDDTYFVNGEAKKFNGYCTDVFFDEALKFIEDKKDESFFCYIATNAPHGPYNVEDTYANPYKDQTNASRAKFYGMITNIDDNFARLRAKLDELNLSDNTIVIFMTDNGTSCGFTEDDHGFVVDGYNNGLRGSKNSEYDGGHRVPFFVKWPKGNIGGGKDFNELSANVDFMPTLLDLCDIHDCKEEFHGRSLVPFFREEEQVEDRVIVTDSQRVAYPIKWRKSAVMTKEWRLINGEELYAINEDREQKHDISNNHPEVVERLRKAYDEWWIKVSVQYDGMIPYVLNDKTTMITCHDLRNHSSSDESNPPWHQGFIREGQLADGYYEVEVAVSGDYEFNLRRWPKSENRPIQAGIEGDDVFFEKQFIDKNDWGLYQGGEALNIAMAQIEIDGQSEMTTVDKNDTQATFIMNLDKGEKKLVCRFLDKEKNPLTTAYYIEVCKVN